MRDIWSKVVGIKGTSGATGAPGVHGADLEMLTQEYYREQAAEQQRHDEVGRVPPPTAWQFIRAVVGKFLMWGLIAGAVYVAFEAIKFALGLLGR